MNDRNASILLVDDDRDICQNLSDILADLDYRVDVAHDASSALRLLEGQAYDLALLDLRMPGMDGLSLYREIKKRSTGTQAILVTGHADRETVEEATREGFSGVLHKPVGLPRLFEALTEVLDRPLIMIVDDDHELCASLADVLRDLGFRVFVSHDEPDAVRKLSHKCFQVVLIDMKLPSSDGREVYRQVHRMNPDARTIVITGHRMEMEPLIAWVLDEGADAICYKPFQVEDLLNTIRGLSG